jgi:lipopolysaccharide transport system permease protein
MTGFNFLIRLMILIPSLGFFAWKGVYTFSLSSLWLFPVGVLSIVILGYTIGILLTPIGMLYKDISMAMGMIMMFWMFVSPVVMTIPESGLVSQVMRWNPISPILDTTRAWLVGVDPLLIGHYAVVMAISAVFLVIGWILYRVALPHVIARLGM